MAYQSKKHRKFVATTVTAALVATAVAPAAGFAAEKSFTDQIPTWAQDAVSYLVEKGAIEGYPNGTFGSADPLTRAQAAKVLALALELDVDLSASADFADVPAGNWASPYIAAIQDLGIIQGDEKGNFNPNAKIDRQSFAKMVVEAYGLELDENADVSFSDNNSWGAEYIEVLASLGVIQGVGGDKVAPRADVSRGEAAVFVHRTEVEDVRKEVPTKTPVVVDATKVEAVSADNLKEIVVKFDGLVDKASAQDVDKYSVDSSVELESATLLEDGKTVRLTVAPFANGLVLQNQKAYKISVKNVKAGDKFVDASNVAFTPVDNTLPEVAEVKSLGTKAVKVTFSEPVKTATSANFKLDGKSFFGSVSEGARSVILKPYTSSDLAVGTHKLEVSGVEDYANFKSLTKEFDFEVVEDTVAPTVKSVSATLEKVTITFSEEVDPDTVSKSNIYWKSGADKKAAGSVTEIAPDVYEFDFSANALPGYEMTLYVEGVKDYSGNQITETEVKVRAEVDQTRPEVSEAAISKLDNKNITLKFNKTVKIEDIKYFTLTDSDGDAVAIRNVVAANGTTEDKVFTIQTYDELTDTYTLKVVGVRDTTKLQNTMNDYSVTLTGKDTAAPSYTSNSANSATRTIIINFDEKMDLASLADSKNYLVTINNKSQQLPAGTEVTPVQDGKAVRIVFPEYIENAKVGINDSTLGANVTAFKLLALKDVAGNIITNFGGEDIPANTSLATLAARYDSNTADPAKLTAKGVVKVKFNQPIGKAVAGDFVVTGSGVSISSVTTDGSDVVTINLSGDLSNTSLETALFGAVTLSVKAGNNILTTSGNRVEHASATPITVKDGVKPQVQLGANQTRLVVQPDGTIELPFSEALEDAAGIDANYKYDLVVTNVRTKAIVAPNLYTTTVVGNKIEIDFVNPVSDEFKVSVKSNASFIQDLAGNKAVASSEYISVPGALDTVAPTATVSTTTVKPGTNVNVQGNEAGTAYLVQTATVLTNKAALDLLVDAGTATKVAINANASTPISTTGLADGTYNVVVVDAAGNLSAKSTGVVTVDGTLPEITSVTSATLDLTAGSLVLTVVGASAIGDSVDVSKLTVKDTDASINYTLSDSTGVVTSATVLTITLSADDKAALATAGGIDVTLDAAVGLLVDAAGNRSTNAADSANAVTVTP